MKKKTKKWTLWFYSFPKKVIKSYKKKKKKNAL